MPPKMVASPFEKGRAEKERIVMEALTVRKLKKLCEQEIKKGNGDKTIMISQDDEGNGYHYLWYSFSQPEGLITREEVSENIAKYEDTIILG